MKYLGWAFTQQSQLLDYLSFQAFDFVFSKIQGGAIMARCPKLDFEDHGGIFMTHDKYVCKLTGLKMDVDASKVKFVCNAEYGEEYETIFRMEG